jgi:signal transduction histidine kinase
LDHLGLIPALEHYIEVFDDQNDLVVNFEVVGIKKDRLTPASETALYRIVQEAMTNVLRHAEAGRVDVLLERRGDHVVVVIEDDGVGFDLDAALQSGRLGLLGMRERAEMLGGSLVIESNAGEGTTIVVEVPVHAKGEEAKD